MNTSNLYKDPYEKRWERLHSLIYTQQVNKGNKIVNFDGMQGNNYQKR